MMAEMDAGTARQQVIDWFERVVLGLDLCPFARRPWRQDAIRFTVSESVDEPGVLRDLARELERLDRQPQIETTLLVLPYCLRDFDDYNAFLDPVDALLETGGWAGRYQVASFHPDYRFADSLGDADAADWTNRSPWPLLHLIREASLERAVAAHPDPAAIPGRNVHLLRGMTVTQLRELFGSRYPRVSD
jgi:hypothetical protein